MFASLMPILLKYVLPFLLQELVKSGVMNQLEADGIKDLGAFVTWAKSIKIYPEYPAQKDNSFNDPSLEP